MEPRVPSTRCRRNIADRRLPGRDTTRAERYPRSTVLVSESPIVVGLTALTDRIIRYSETACRHQCAAPDVSPTAMTNQR